MSVSTAKLLRAKDYIGASNRCSTCGRTLYKLDRRRYCPYCEDVPYAATDAEAAQKPIKMEGPRECSRCGRHGKIFAREMCRRCYDRDWYHRRCTEDGKMGSPRKIVTCKKCGEEKPHQARGLCAKCYYHERRAARELLAVFEQRR